MKGISVFDLSVAVFMRALHLAADGRAPLCTSSNRYSNSGVRGEAHHSMLSRFLAQLIIARKVSSTIYQIQL